MILKSFLLVLLITSAQAVQSEDDVGQTVSGAEVEDTLGKVQDDDAADPFILGQSEGELEKYKSNTKAQADYLFNPKLQEVSPAKTKNDKFESIGYTPPYSFEKEQTYLEVDKADMARDFRKLTNASFNVTYIKDTYNYESPNDIIERTINQGAKRVKAGTLHLRSDQYFFRTDFLNTFWLGGAGVGFNSGRGVFVTGQKSNTTFRFWEIPVDLGLGFDIPLYHWFKISAAAGPSGMALIQNRNDLQQGEDGRNKTQISYGQFANAQFRINLSGFSPETAYDLFTSSNITNLYLNLEARYQNYQNFQDAIKISGTSLGVGFTFEYL